MRHSTCIFCPASSVMTLDLITTMPKNLPPWYEWWRTSPYATNGRFGQCRCGLSLAHWLPQTKCANWAGGDPKWNSTGAVGPSCTAALIAFDAHGPFRSGRFPKGEGKPIFWARCTHARVSCAEGSGQRFWLGLGDLLAGLGGGEASSLLSRLTVGMLAVSTLLILSNHRSGGWVLKRRIVRSMWMKCESTRRCLPEKSKTAGKSSQYKGLRSEPEQFSKTKALGCCNAQKNGMTVQVRDCLLRPAPICQKPAKCWDSVSSAFTQPSSKQPRIGNRSEGPGSNAKTELKSCLAQLFNRNIPWDGPCFGVPVPLCRSKWLRNHLGWLCEVVTTAQWCSHWKSPMRSPGK